MKRTILTLKRIHKLLLVVCFIALNISLSAQNQGTITVDGREYYIHTVQMGESLYSISKEYGVPESAIALANKENFLVLQVGENLKIPVDGKVYPTSGSNFIYHVVQTGQTLSDIARRYNVSREALQEHNPDAANGIEGGEIIKVPKQTIQPDVDGDVNSVINYLDAPCSSYSYNPATDEFNVAILLPLYLAHNSGFAWETPRGAENISFYAGSEKFLEFYEGALIALDSLRKDGLSLNVFVYDTENNAATVRDILAKPHMQSLDLIIGPVYPDNVDLVADFAQEQQINIVSPLSQNEEVLSSNPFFFQVNSSMFTRISVTAKYLEQFQNSNVILVHKNTDEELEDIRTFQNQLNNNTNLTYEVVNYSSSQFSGLKNQLSKTSRNILVFTSTNEVFVTDVLTKLHNISKYYPITVFGLHSWENYAGVEIEYYKNLNIHYHSTYFIDYQRWEVKDFVRNYRRLFNAEPSVYSIQGFDVTYFFLKTMKRFGPRFQYCLSALSSVFDKKGIQCNFDLQKISTTGGYENYGVWIIKYNDMYQQVGVDLQQPVPYTTEE